MGQLETFPAFSRMSAPGGKADGNDAKAEVAVGMSAVGGGADLDCQGLSGPFIAKSCRTLCRFDHDDFHQTLDFIHGLLTTNLYVAQ